MFIISIAAALVGLGVGVDNNSGVQVEAELPAVALENLAFDSFNLDFAEVCGRLQWDSPGCLCVTFACLHLRWSVLVVLRVLMVFIWRLLYLL